MQRTMLKSKLHRATVTGADLEYEGSVTIDKNLLKAGNIWPFERIEIYNITNGNRLASYAIEGEAGSGVICMNGAAAHLASPGDLVIICTYVEVKEEDLPTYEKKIILLDENNQPKQILDN